MATTIRVTTDELLSRYHAAVKSLGHFGKHPANEKIRAELTEERDSCRKQLEQRGVRGFRD